MQGTVRGMEVDLANIGLVLGPALVLLYIGFALATIVAGLFLRRDRHAPGPQRRPSWSGVSR